MEIATPHSDHRSEKLNINQWAEEDRPREKLMRQGPEALSNAELLAILIGSGSTKESAVDLMKRVLGDCNNNLNTLGKMTIRQLCEYNGVGEAKAITILAACELGKRRQMETPEERPDLGTATRIYNHMHPLMQDLDVEEFWLLLMNQNYRLIKSSASRMAASPRSVSTFASSCARPYWPTPPSWPSATTTRRAACTPAYTTMPSPPH